MQMNEEPSRPYDFMLNSLGGFVKGQCEHETYQKSELSEPSYRSERDLRFGGFYLWSYMKSISFPLHTFIRSTVACNGSGA